MDQILLIFLIFMPFLKKSKGKIPADFLTISVIFQRIGEIRILKLHQRKDINKRIIL